MDAKSFAESAISFAFSDIARTNACRALCTLAKLVWDTLYQTDTSLRAEAVTYGISSAAYATAFSTLNTYLAS
ncbi:hypothetical protein IAF46_14035, partial [Acinetobacter baumannii]|nr:hypothetical protein [Acinetobacter baumannii]